MANGQSMSAARKTKERSSDTAEAVSRLSAALLVARADELMGCTENSPEEAELAALTELHRGLRTSALAAWKSARRQRLMPSEASPQTDEV
jgi:hypothetical protein